MDNVRLATEDEKYANTIWTSLWWGTMHTKEGTWSFRGVRGRVVGISSRSAAKFDDFAIKLASQALLCE